MAFDAAAFRVNDGFVNPRLYGFSDRITDITLRMFPFQEHYIVDGGAGDAATQAAARRFTALCGLPNVEDRLVHNTNCREMNGIVWASSLFSPPVLHDEYVDRAVFGAEQIASDYALNGVGGVTIGGWIHQYLANQFHTLLFHLHLQRDANTQGAFNTFIDITQPTLLSKSFNVRAVLASIRGCQILGSLNDPQLIPLIQDHKTNILDSIVADIGDLQEHLPLWKILTILIYRAFRILRGQQAEGYLCRVYYYKRQGRFLRLPGQPGGGAGGTSRSAGVPYGIGQYIRYFVWFQQPFAYFANWYSPNKKCIFRDAHATGINGLSAEIDRHFFTNVPARRTLILGIHSVYKLVRHAKLNPAAVTLTMGNNQQAVVPNSIDSVDDTRMGVLAGAVWSYNPNPEERFLSYDIFFQPFGNLDAAGPAGIQYPTTMNATDKLARINGANWDYWGYGLDEYLLSLIFQLRFTRPELWDDVIVCYLHLHWLGKILAGPGVIPSEYYPELNNSFCGIVGPQEAAIRAANPVNFQRYYSQLLDAFTIQVNGAPRTVIPKKVILEFLFSSANIPSSYLQHYNVAPMGAGNRYFQTNPIEFLCYIYNAHRFDRFDYYNNPAMRIMNGNPEVPTHCDSFNNNLTWAITNPITYGCGRGEGVAGDPCLGVKCPHDIIRNQAIPQGAAAGGVAPPPAPPQPAPPQPAPPQPAPPGIPPIDGFLARAAAAGARLFPGGGGVGPGVGGPGGGLFNNDENDNPFAGFGGAAAGFGGAAAGFGGAADPFARFGGAAGRPALIDILARGW
jgi:hypothetical protein